MKWKKKGEIMEEVNECIFLKVLKPVKFLNGWQNWLPLDLQVMENKLEHNIVKQSFFQEENLGDRRGINYKS